MKISVKVAVNKSKSEIKKIDDSNFQVELKSIPEKGNANKELIKILSEYYNVPKNLVIIKSGIISKNKIIEIKL
jgi:hypothetical protein